MEIAIRSTRPEDNDVVRSLCRLLQKDDTLEGATFDLSESKRADDLGAELTVAVIDVVLGTGFNLANLALALGAWREQSGVSAPLEYECNGRTTTLSAADTNGVDDGELVIERALVGASDPTSSNCVLIGVGNYGRLRPVPGVRENLIELSAALTDGAIWGIPEARVKTMTDPRTPSSVLEAISDAAAHASDTLLVYFVGHGVHDGDRGLALALPHAPRNERPRDDQVVRWRDLAAIVAHATARRTVVWLDCCYSGLALAAQGNADGPPDLLDAADVRGSYVFAAAQGAGPAKVADDGGCTAFTRELVRVLREGIEPGPPREEFLSLNWLHTEVRNALLAHGFPEPGWNDPGYIGHLPQFRNNRAPVPVPVFVPDDPDPVPDGPDPVPDGPDEPRQRWYQNRRTLGFAALSLVVLALLFGLWSIPGPVVSGLSLTGYCSGLAPGGPQRFRIAGDDCVQEVDLDAACVYQYRQPDLKARFTTPDANSAVCDNPSTGFTYEAGISDMRGYCATRTTVPTVEATAENARYDNTWVCQVPINTDLACNSQNNRTDLASREEDDGRWSCHRAHLF